jgi:glutamine phosphoribosylpyrophosphate amidotransferase
MCGLLGVFSDRKDGFSVRDLDILMDLFHVNELRGRDSTGIITINAEGVSDWIKQVGGAKDLFDTKDWDDTRNSLWKNGRIAIGHGRAASVGSVTLENAHPFEYKKPGDNPHTITVVHNGTLDKYQRLGDYHKYDVDSQWMAAKILVLKLYSRLCGVLSLRSGTTRKHKSCTSIVMTRGRYSVLRFQMNFGLFIRRCLLSCG